MFGKIKIVLISESLSSRSIQQEVIRLRTKSVHRNRSSTTLLVTEGFGIAVHAARRIAIRAARHTRSQQRQPGKITAIQGQRPAPAPR